MRKNIFARLFVFLSLVLGAVSVRAVAPTSLHAYGAFGNNYIFPGAIRLGWKSWEFGTFVGQGGYGAFKRHYFKPSYYTGFGLLVVGVVDSAHPAFSGGIGFDYKLLLGLGLRGELLGIAATNGLLLNRANIGLSYKF